MKCQHFKEVTAELARGQLSDSQQEEAMLHAAACASCAARLSDEQALTTLFRAERAASLQNEGAPPALEQNLRNAFRLYSAESQAASRMSPRIHSHTYFGWRKLAPTLAATLVLLAAFFSARMFRQYSHSATITTAAPNPSVTPLTNVVRSDNAPSDSDDEGAKKSTNRLAQVKVTRRTASRRTRPSAPVTKTYETTVVSGRDEGTMGEETAEIATDFFPLTDNTANQTPLESGQIVRVRVPRSTLVAFGLPVNMDRENGSVKADILLGNDGLAQAIRFVR